MFVRSQCKLQAHDATFWLPCLDQLLDIDTIRRELNKAFSQFRACQKQATLMCMKCYDKLLERYEDDENPETKNESARKARIVRNTITSEVTLTTFSDIC